MNKKSMILTLDAMFAILTALTLLTAIMFYTSNISIAPYSSISLNKISQDSLTILEKSGGLQAAIKTGNNAALAFFIEEAFPQICSEIDLYTVSDELLANITRANCDPSSEPVIARRVFIVSNSGIYYARMKSWYKK